jgi:predicted transcriptional regulator
MYYLKSQFTQYDENASSLLMFGKVISEKVRLEMIDMLIRNNEMTNTEMARELDLTPASCYYHTEMMQKTGILNYRTKGREVFFSIDENAFASFGRLVFGYIGKIKEKYTQK